MTYKSILFAGALAVAASGAIQAVNASTPHCKKAEVYLEIHRAALNEEISTILAKTSTPGALFPTSESVQLKWEIANLDKEIAKGNQEGCEVSLEQVRKMRTDIVKAYLKAIQAK